MLILTLLFKTNFCCENHLYKWILCGPYYEFRKHKQSAENRSISRKQFLDEYNNPDHYRPRVTSSNRSHKGEDITNNYFGIE